MNDTFLTIHKISKRFAGVNALSDVSLDIKKAEIRCVAGENGSGKSTLIKIMSGVYQPDSGALNIEGREYKHLKPIEAIREGIQVIYQDFSLFPNLSVAENLALNTLVEQKKIFYNQKNVQRIAVEALSNLDVDINLKQTIINDRICHSMQIFNHAKRRDRG